MIRRTACALAVIFASSAASAATVFNITGPAPFGFANQIVIVQAWSQAATYSNVTITMPLADLSAGGPIGGTEGTVYLMNQIGPGTTSANQVAPPVVISGLTASFVPKTLFTGLNLGPGNYYMVLASTSANSLSMSPQGSSNPVITPGPGVAALGGGSVLVAAPYPPASPLVLDPPGNLFIAVTGDLVSLAAARDVPALDGIGLGVLLLGLAGAAAFVLRSTGA